MGSGQNYKISRSGANEGWERFQTGLLSVAVLLSFGSPAMAGGPNGSLFEGAQAKSESLGKVRGTRDEVQNALQTQSHRIDRQIAEFENRFILAKEGQYPSSMPTKDESSSKIGRQGVPSTGQASSMEEEVQMMDETVVTDTYLDPFDEEIEAEVVEDPWESMNSRTFSFNLKADQYVLKPLAKGYAWILPDPVERAIGRAIHNIRFVPRTMNNLFQQKWVGASTEAGRFLINSTVGLAGLFDVAESQFGLKPTSSEDLGQTFAMYGVRSGPYLVLPLLPPTTVRDGVGLIGDTLLDPVSYFVPFFPQASLRTTEVVDDRSKNMELYEGVESSTVDLYGAVRSGYMQRRQQAIQE